jgi:acetyl esterase/lipase
MRTQLAELQRLRPQPYPSLTPEEMRRQPQLLDAARAVENVKGLPYPELPVPQFQLVAAEGETGPLPARLYQPKAPKNAPLILYFADSFVAPNLDAADVAARALVQQTGDVVVVAGMRPAPESRFPTAHTDALAVLGWARKNARSWGADPSRLVLAGEGTGALLALTTAIAARNDHLPRPSHLLLITPMAAPPPYGGPWARAQPRPAYDARWDLRQYTGGSIPRDPRLDPLHLADLRYLPPVTMVLAEGDPLRPDAEALLDKLRAAGVPAQARIFPGASAEFFPLGQVVPDAKGAEGFVGDQLKAAFGRG